jgi:hypothetical protein
VTTDARMGPIEASAPEGIRTAKVRLKERREMKSKATFLTRRDNTGVVVALDVPDNSAGGNHQAEDDEAQNDGAEIAQTVRSHSKCHLVLSAGAFPVVGVPDRKPYCNHKFGRFSVDY